MTGMLILNGRRARIWRAHGCNSASIEREKAFPSPKSLPRQAITVKQYYEH